MDQFGPPSSKRVRMKRGKSAISIRSRGEAITIRGGISATPIRGRGKARLVRGRLSLMPPQPQPISHNDNGSAQSQASHFEIYVHMYVNFDVRLINWYEFVECGFNVI